MSTYRRIENPTKAQLDSMSKPPALAHGPVDAGMMKRSAGVAELKKAPTLPDEASSPADAMKATLAKYQPHARAIQETSAAAVLATCVGKGYGEEFTVAAFKAYHDNVLEAAGQPSDPIEAMLVEQLLWAHHRIGTLHAQAARATTPETTGLYNAAAVRLIGEFRKTSLALRDYRSPAAPKHLTVVRQQNLANGDQQVAYIDQQPADHPPALPPVTSPNRDTELKSNHLEAIVHEPKEEEEALVVPGHQADRDRPGERVDAKLLAAGKPRKGAASGVPESAMAVLDGPENPGG
jgi:hypothetical protein